MREEREYLDSIDWQTHAALDQTPGVKIVLHQMMREEPYAKTIGEHQPDSIEVIYKDRRANFGECLSVHTRKVMQVTFKKGGQAYDFMIR